MTPGRALSGLPLGCMLPGILQTLTSEGFGLEYALGSLLSLVLLLVLGLLLLLWALAIAAHWVGPDAPSPDGNGLSPRALELLGYRMRGAGLQASEKAWKSP